MVDDTQDTGLPLAIYVLYFVGLVTWLPALVGVILAHANAAAAPDWIASHYEWQIRTFWFGAGFVFVGYLLTWVLIGYLVLLAWFVWAFARTLIGLQTLRRRAPIEDVGNLLW